MQEKHAFGRDESRGLLICITRARVPTSYEVQ